MAKSEKSDKWFARVDGAGLEALRDKYMKLIGAIDTKCLFGAFHLGEKKDNPHIHFVIEIANPVQKQSFALRIKTLFGIEKKSQYALAVWDGVKGPGAMSYCYHEPDAVILPHTGISGDDIERAKFANESVQRVVAVNKEKASHKLVEKAYEYCRNELNHFDIHKCLTFMLSEIKEGNNYHPGEFMLKRYCEEVQVRMEDNTESLASEMINRWYRV